MHAYASYSKKCLQNNLKKYVVLKDKKDQPFIFYFPLSHNLHRIYHRIIIYYIFIIYYCINYVLLKSYI